MPTRIAWPPRATSEIASSIVRSGPTASKLWSTRTDSAASSGEHARVAPISRASSCLAGLGSTATISPAPATAAAWTMFRPTPPHPTTATESPGPDPGGVQHGAEGCHDRAAHERHLAERQAGVDGDRGLRRYDRPFAERRGRRVVDRHTVAMKPGRPVHHQPGVRPCELLADVGPARHAEPAPAAVREPAQDDMVAGRDAPRRRRRPPRPRRRPRAPGSRAAGGRGCRRSRAGRSGRRRSRPSGRRPPRHRGGSTSTSSTRSGSPGSYRIAARTRLPYLR